MPLKLNVGASRKVTDNNYGSRGASINVELELDTSLVGEPARLQERIRQLFGVVRVSLAEELNGSNGHSNGNNHGPNQNGASGETNGHSGNGHSSNGSSPDSTPRLA